MAFEVRQAPPVGYVSVPALTSIFSLAEDVKRTMARMLDATAGHRLLDVGCGPGLDVRSLSESVSPGGLVVSVDHDAQMIATANGRMHSRPGHAAGFLLGDALDLPFVDGAFERSRCERVLQHVRAPSLVLAELYRVTADGGVAVVADTDWASLSIDCEDDRLERRITRIVADCFADGYAGRQLVRLMREAGFEVSGVETRPIHWTSLDTFCATSFPATTVVDSSIRSGRLSRLDWERFVTLLKQADSGSGFFASASVVVVAGRKQAPGDGRK